MNFEIIKKPNKQRDSNRKDLYTWVSEQQR